MFDCKPVGTPMATRLKMDQDHGGKVVDDTHYKQIVGSLMYLTNTRPDIMHATCSISRYMSNPTELHMQAAKRILRSNCLGSKKQPIVTPSTTEAEFVAATACACQLLWMKRILKALKHEERKCTEIRCDNNSTIKLSRNPVMHGRCKHIDMRSHFLRDLVKEGTIILSYCRSEDLVADVMTKALKVDAFLKQRQALGMHDHKEVMLESKHFQHEGRV
ncbi:hypothetical protein LIER_21611 [Lithospermum erythrorhizon]|uniref:Polyprotein n=1 Tax=Lithospermum erythrorhizon TaxID=34254 RepID=A0AAV3QS28_LITER